MNKWGNDNFGGSTYDTNCPFDMAQKIVDKCDHQGQDVHFVRDLLDWEMDGYHNSKGMKVVECFKLLTGYGMANNVGVPQVNIDLYIEYYEWAKSNDKDVVVLFRDLYKCFVNNHGTRDFSALSDLHLLEEKHEHYEEYLLSRDITLEIVETKRKLMELERAKNEISN